MDTGGYATGSWPRALKPDLDAQGSPIRDWVVRRTGARVDFVNAARRWWSVAGVFVFSLALGCASEEDGDGGGGGGGNGFLGSCDTRTDNGECRDWQGSPGADLQVSCDGIGGTFSDTQPCPDTERVGQCTLAPVLNTTAVYNYYSPEYDEQTASDDCDGFQDGTFTPG